jgi:hypothetical protein
VPLRHCCDSTLTQFEDGMLIYSPEERAYGVIVHNGTTRWIAFCPWCGTDLNELPALV